VDFRVASPGGGKLARGELRRLRVSGGRMRAIVTCECCGHRQAVERSIKRPEAFHLVCHCCEGVLRVEVTADDLRAAATATAAGKTPAKV
jgi:transcription elongation factor Elf1